MVRKQKASSSQRTGLLVVLCVGVHLFVVSKGGDEQLVIVLVSSQTSHVASSRFFVAYLNVIRLPARTYHSHEAILMH